MIKRRPRLILIAILLTVWTFPLARAGWFCVYAARMYQEEHSVNAWNDVAYGIGLLEAYSASIFVPAALLLLPRMNALLGSLLVSASLFIAMDVIRIHPEEVIVLVPTMNPLRPVR